MTERARHWLRATASVAQSSAVEHRDAGIGEAVEDLALGARDGFDRAEKADVRRQGVG